MKLADKLVRKKDVEFIAVIPPETVNAFYNEMVGASNVAAAHGTSTGESDKAQRQQDTGMHSFKDNPGFDLLQEFAHIFHTELPVGLPEHGEHEMEVIDPERAVYTPQWRLSPLQETELREWATVMLKAGLIRPSK
ncbi:hypothetical protein PI124_g21261 [Phytophthora idaei]|nr:hypothetical protein PI125_g23645 [Phytophthora idaei]KAG3127617.1 hypothetical protein PI126_g21779 [Phytophthora idaei]KAG3233672.1 hypothetical protein PI124_g21261 [Phytophthora idaei]